MSEMLGFREPVVPSHFRDRTEEIKQIVCLIEQKKWCGVFGIGGTGKTMLAASIAQQARKSLKERVIWFEIGENPEYDLILESLAKTVGSSLRSTPDIKQKKSFLRALTGDKGLLIIFDDVNDDHILNQLLECIGAGNAVLITGRDQGLKSVVRYHLTPILVESLPLEEATDILMELSGIDSNTKTNRGVWQQLSQAVGNLPLAIELIAGDLRFQPDPLQYLEQEINTGKWLQDTASDLSSILHQALKRSLDALGTEYINAFACLGVFTGRGFDRQAIQRVCGFPDINSTNQFVSELMKRMLLRCDADKLTFFLHPIVKQFAREQMLQIGSTWDTENSPVERYISYYLGLTQTTF